MTPTLSYWERRGFGNPIRMLLYHVGHEFVDKRYNAVTLDDWFLVDKPKMAAELDFPNLPNYIDEHVKLSQTLVILEYLGKKHHMDGRTEAEKIRMHLATEVVADMRAAFDHIAFPGGTLETAGLQEFSDLLYKNYGAQIPAKLAQFAKFLRKGGDKWVAGDRHTYTDFFVYDILDWHRQIYGAQYIEAEPTLVAYFERFEELKGVKEYLKNPKLFQRLPIFGDVAFVAHHADYKPKPL